MKLQKEFNEYGDKLVSLETAINAEAVGFDIPQVECFTITRGVPKDKAFIFDEWFGMISDDQEFLCYRPTVTYLQKWLRDKCDVHVFIGYRPSIRKWDTHAFDLKLYGEESIPMKKFLTVDIYDTYDEALEAGVCEAVNLLLKRGKSFPGNYTNVGILNEI